MGSALAAGASALMPGAARIAVAAPLTLTAGPATVPLVGGKWPDTKVWAYNGDVPGTEIRVRQGDTVRVLAHNGLEQPTTVHKAAQRHGRGSRPDPGGDPARRRFSI